MGRHGAQWARPSQTRPRPLCCSPPRMAGSSARPSAPVPGPGPRRRPGFPDRSTPGPCSMTPSAPLRSAAKNPMRTAGRPVSVLANVPGGDRVPARLARAAARRDSPLPATTSRPWPHSHKHRALNRCARHRRGTPAQLMRTPARGSRTWAHAGQGYQAGRPAPAQRQGPRPTRTGESVRAAARTLARNQAARNRRYARRERMKRHEESHPG